MASKANETLRNIGHLIFLIENSGIEKVAKFKIVKVLLAVKLKLLDLLKREIELEAKSVQKMELPDSQIPRDSEKQELILEFIKNNGGRVDSAQLVGLGMAGRSLRRYIKDLRDNNRIKTEKSGRNLFYLVV